MVTHVCFRLGCVIFICFTIGMVSACSGFGARARHAAVAVVRDPWIWGPIAGAALISATNNDERISRWARAKTPVYGSGEAASEASDRFRLYASQSTWATFLAASPQAEGNWYANKGVDAGNNLMGLAMVRTSTGLLKGAAERERPNRSPTHDSFPSSHASDAFAHAAIMRHYANDLPVSRSLRSGVQWVTNGFAFATAWGRVEGGFHYPTDVLMGAALANFTTHLVTEMDDSAVKPDWRVRPRTDEYGKLVIEIQKPF